MAFTTQPPWNMFRPHPFVASPRHAWANDALLWRDAHRTHGAVKGEVQRQILLADGPRSFLDFSVASRHHVIMV